MIEAQADLAGRIQHNDAFIRFALEMVTTSLGLKGLRDFQGNHAKSRTAATLMSLFYQSAAEARCYHVSKDMCALIQHAAAGLDETDLVEFYDLAPTNYGLVRFDGGGLEVIDPRGEVMKLDWLLWGDCAFVVDNDPDNMHNDTVVPRRSERITAEGFSVWEFNDRVDNPDGISLAIAEQVPTKGLNDALGRWNIMGNHVVQTGTEVGPAMLMATGLQRESILARGEQPVPATNTLRLLHAFWLLLQQPITEEDIARLTGPARKAAKAKGVKRAQADRDVSVIDIRKAARQAKPADSDGTKRHVEWRGQWIVNGFWRWQAYGPGRKQRKRIWVDGFVKGPADLPLIKRKHVYTVKG